MINEQASNDPLLTKSEVAKMVASDIRLSVRHVYDRYMAIPSFPKPKRIPSAAGRKPRLVWTQSSIARYLAGIREAA